MSKGFALNSFVRLILLMVLFTSHPAIAADTTVTVQPWGATQTQFFDPTKSAGTAADPNKPGDLPGPPVDKNGKPLLKPGEVGGAVYKVDATFNYKASGAGGQVTITKLDVNVTGSTAIYLPSGATQQLTDHENGHDTLYRDEYSKSAQQIVSQSVSALVGTKYSTQQDAEAAIYNALNNRGIGGVNQQLESGIAKFDTLTDKGKNDKVDPGTGKTIDTPTGIAMTKAELAKAPPAGQTPAKPADTKPHAATAPDPANVSFDEITSKLSFGGDLNVIHASDPLDQIIGRGLFQIDPLIAIGPMEDGGIHLSDSALKIVDNQTGDALLSGLLLQVAYIPSTLPGFAGMIQGYLDIPPDFVGGINNTIGSNFLYGMGAAAAAGDLTTFWFYADQPLFDAQGNSLISESGASGNVKIGVVPEPSTLLLFLAGVTVILAIGYRTWKATS